MPRPQLTGILGQRRLQFSDNRALAEYYEEKYRQGGYVGGCIAGGVNISQIYHRARHASALAFLDPQPGEIILDAGCGDGSLAARIAPLCQTVHAVDIAGNALDPCHREISNLRFQKMNIEALDFADAAFDKIVCVESLEHLLFPHQALTEFHRVLKPGGRLVLTYPTINRTIMHRFQRRLRLSRPLPISEHLTEWSYDDVVRHTTTAGFKFRQAEGLVFDFGVFGWIKFSCRFLAKRVTRLALRIRAFPRNSAFVSVVFHKP